MIAIPIIKIYLRDGISEKYPKQNLKYTGTAEILQPTCESCCLCISKLKSPSDCAVRALRDEAPAPERPAARVHQHDKPPI